MDRLIRRFHRWTSIVFVAGVITYMVMMSGGEQPPTWVGLLALAPLIVLTLTGVFMCARHYLAKLGKPADGRA